VADFPDAVERGPVTLVVRRERVFGADVGRQANGISLTTGSPFTISTSGGFERESLNCDSV
jgi:hypothetical protein